MQTLPPDPGRVLATLRAVLVDLRALLAADPHDERLMSTLSKLERAEAELDSYAGQARPLQ